MKQATNTATTGRHYLSLIQEARHSAEELVRLADQLPAELIERQLARAKANLEAGLAAKAALPPHPLRDGSTLASDMADRALRAIETLEARS